MRNIVHAASDSASAHCRAQFCLQGHCTLCWILPSKFWTWIPVCCQCLISVFFEQLEFFACTPDHLRQVRQRLERTGLSSPLMNSSCSHLLMKMMAAIDRCHLRLCVLQKKNVGSPLLDLQFLRRNSSSKMSEGTNQSRYLVVTRRDSAIAFACREWATPHFQKSRAQRQVLPPGSPAWRRMGRFLIDKMHKLWPHHLSSCFIKGDPSKSVGCPS